jgi:hypothetical protein
VEDLTHNFFLETRARTNKLKARKGNEELALALADNALAAPKLREWRNGLGRMAPSPRTGPGLADSPKSAPSYPRRLKA